MTSQTQESAKRRLFPTKGALWIGLPIIGPRTLPAPDFAATATPSMPARDEPTQHHVLSAETLQSNQRWNALPWPFTALRHGVSVAIFSICFLAIGFGGSSG